MKTRKILFLFLACSLTFLETKAGTLRVPKQHTTIQSAIDAGLWWLALIGILMAFVGLYYYLNIIKVMYLYRSEQDDVAIPVSRAAQVGLVIAVAFIIYLGIQAGPAFELTREAAAAFFPG